ncbi:MAG: lipid-A-disaccharide synthase [Candidatus Marinimicrobia bacterium]|nr:lipid-A-disaccharide synthase [Candidatus Neomarinimicrobiota bacterium]
MSSNKIFISAGELSGDVHGGNLIKEIKKLEPNISISAIGGDNMARYGAKLLYHIRDTAFMGFVEVIKHLSVIKNIWRHTLNFIDKEKPDLIILIDYPGFNLRLARAAHKRGIPVIYYISPQVWAWHQSRIKNLKRHTKEVLCIFPFEESWYRERGVNATFVGHPLLDIKSSKHKIPKPPPKIKTKNASHLIGLFPGSRKQEVNRHLKILIRSAEILREKHKNLEAVVAIAPDINFDKYKRAFPHIWLHWIRGRNDEIMLQSDLLILSSGTVTVEAAINQVPMVVIYRLSPISYLLGKIFIRIPFIAMANLIAGIRGVPELIQKKASPQNIATEAERVLANPEIRHKIKNFLKDVSSKLGRPGATKKASKIIISHIHSIND